MCVISVTSTLRRGSEDASLLAGGRNLQIDTLDMAAGVCLRMMPLSQTAEVQSFSARAARPADKPRLLHHQHLHRIIKTWMRQMMNQSATLVLQARLVFLKLSACFLNRSFQAAIGH